MSVDYLSVTTSKWAYYSSIRSGAQGTESAGDDFEDALEEAGGSDDAVAASYAEMLARLEDNFSDVQFAVDSYSNKAIAVGAAAPEAAITVNLTEEVLGAMAGDEALSAMVQDAIADFLSATDSLQPPEGNSLARSVSVSSASMSFSVGMVDDETGLVEMQQQLEAGLKDGITLIINKFFGVAEVDSGTGGTDETDETGGTGGVDETDETDETDGTDETGGVGGIDETDETDETDGTDETGGIGGVDETDETDETGETDGVGDIDETDETDETDDVDETDGIGGVDETDETDDTTEVTDPSGAGGTDAVSSLVELITRWLESLNLTSAGSWSFSISYSQSYIDENGASSSQDFSFEASSAYVGASSEAGAASFQDFINTILPESIAGLLESSEDSVSTLAEALSQLGISGTRSDSTFDASGFNLTLSADAESLLMEFLERLAAARAQQVEASQQTDGDAIETEAVDAAEEVEEVEETAGAEV